MNDMPLSDMPLSDVEKLGQLVREETEESPRSKDVLREARSRFEMSVIERAQSRRPAFSLGHSLAAAALVASVAVGVWSWVGADESPIAVTVETREDRVVGRWIVAEEETKQMRFSDGTSVSMHPHTRLKVTETTSRGATVDLGKGRALAQIEPRTRATWKFLAGPYTVRVTGTEFDLAWDPETRVLELALHQGAVLLSGPSISTEREVRKGEFVRLTAPATDAHGGKRADGDDATNDAVDGLAGAETEAEKRAAAGETGSEGADGTAEDNIAKDGTAKDRASAPDSTAPKWRELLKQGSSKEALVAVQQAGSRSVLNSASAEELWSLARAARLGGQPALARDALLALRNQHGTRGQTSYLLGKIHADQLKATSEAISWFETYLREAPGGSLAEQAMGRLVELQAGSRRGQKAAERYLNSYPSGSYADFARSSLR